MSDPECLVCNEPTPAWGLCKRCEDSAALAEARRQEQARLRLEDTCRWCGSVFPGHRCGRGQR